MNISAFLKKRPIRARLFHDKGISVLKTSGSISVVICPI